MKIETLCGPIMSAFFVLLAGCATDHPARLGPGERAAYLVINHTDQPVLAAPQLRAAKSGQVLYANLQAISNKPARPVQLPRAGYKQAAFGLDPGDENLALPATVDFAFAPTGKSHRVPDIALLRWRSLPDSQSIRVPLRAAIPADVLALIQNPWRYRIEIAVWAIAPGVRIGWQLIDLSGESPRRLRRGGYWPVAS